MGTRSSTSVTHTPCNWLGEPTGPNFLQTEDQRVLCENAAAECWAMPIFILIAIEQSHGVCVCGGVRKKQGRAKEGGDNGERRERDDIIYALSAAPIITLRV